MAYGTLKADAILDSNGDSLVITQVTSSEATTSAKGYMSPADKTKLDGVEAGAEVNTVTSVNGETGAVTIQGFSGDYDDLTNKPTIPTINPDTVVDANYVATDENFTTADHTKLDGIEAGAEVNTRIVSQYSSTVSTVSANTVAGTSYDQAPGFFLTDDGSNEFDLEDFGTETAGPTIWADFYQEAASGTPFTVVMEGFDSFGFMEAISVTYVITGIVSGAVTDSTVTYSYSSRTVNSNVGFEGGQDVLNIAFTTSSSTTVTITGPNNPIFDDTAPVIVDGVTYPTGDWTVSGSTATAALTADPGLVAGDTLVQPFPYLQSADNGSYNHLYTFDGSGNFTATGSVTEFSDINLKENIEVIPNALEKVSELRGVTYDRKDLEGSPRQSGVIAQEVEAVLPEVVQTNDEGIKSVAYGNLVGLLIESIKELQDRVEELENR